MTQQLWLSDISAEFEGSRGDRLLSRDTIEKLINVNFRGIDMPAHLVWAVCFQHKYQNSFTSIRCFNSARPDLWYVRVIFPDRRPSVNVNYTSTDGVPDDLTITKLLVLA